FDKYEPMFSFREFELNFEKEQSYEFCFFTRCSIDYRIDFIYRRFRINCQQAVT
ncbi:MAG: hypothetical protein ACI8TA_003214, partial [Cyclobacteriaceae bacterium]